MNCREIKTSALIKAGLREMPDAYTISYINEIMHELAKKYPATAGRKKTIYLEAERGDWQDLPFNCLSVKRCMKEGNNDVYDDFIIENGQIQFTVPGSYRVECVVTQIPVKAMDDIPKINIAYRDAMVSGVAFKETNRIFMHEDMFQGNNKAMLLQEYHTKAKEANDVLLGMKKSRRRIKFSPFI